MSIPSEIEFSVVFEDISAFKTSYYHKGSAGLRYIQCFPCCGENHSPDVSCGKPVQIMVNILVPHFFDRPVSIDDIVEKLCCVGEFRAFEAVPTIYKALNGNDLAGYLSNHEQNESDMYWGRVVRKFQPALLEQGTLYKVVFEFNTESSVWLCRLRSCKRLRDSSTLFCFGITLLMLSDHSRQSIAAVKYPHVLQTWFQNDIFHPVGYFDSPSFRVSWKSIMFINAADILPPSSSSGHANNTSNGSEVDAKVAHSIFHPSHNDKNADGEHIDHDHSSVLSRMISSAPIFTIQDEFHSDKWLSMMRQAVRRKSRTTSAVSLLDLGFHYEMPAVYKDASQTFLPLFTSLVGDSAESPEKNQLKSLMNEASNSSSTKRNVINKAEQEKRQKLHQAMRRDAATAFLRNKSRIPIATETAALYCMLESTRRLLTKTAHTVDNGAVAAAEFINETNGTDNSKSTVELEDPAKQNVFGGAVTSLNLLQPANRVASVVAGPAVKNLENGSSETLIGIGENESSTSAAVDVLSTCSISNLDSSNLENQEARPSSAIADDFKSVEKDVSALEPDQIPNPTLLLRALHAMYPEELTALSDAQRNNTSAATATAVEAKREDSPSSSSTSDTAGVPATHFPSGVRASSMTFDFLALVADYFVQRARPATVKSYNNIISRSTIHNLHTNKPNGSSSDDESNAHHVKHSVVTAELLADQTPSIISDSISSLAPSVCDDAVVPKKRPLVSIDGYSSNGSENGGEDNLPPPLKVIKLDHERIE